MKSLRRAIPWIFLALAAPAWGISSLQNFDVFALEIFAPVASPDALDVAPAVARDIIIEPETPVASVPEATVGQDDVNPIATLCAQIDEKLTSVSFEDCMSRKLQPSGAVSIRRKAIATRDFVPRDAEPSGRVLLVGGIHGDEYSAVTAVFTWLEQLESQRGGDFHWRVVPLLNPDGLLMPPNESQRMNANGVDLNRNFPTPDWEVEAVDYWVNRTRRSKRRYPGTAPLSEPESRWLAGQIEEYKPDAVISVHAPHGIVDFDGPRIPPDNLGPLELRLLGTYPGSMGRYIGVYKGIPLLTIELESALRLPSDEDMDGIWFDMIDWLDAKVGTPREPQNQKVAGGEGDAKQKRITRADAP